MEPSLLLRNQREMTFESVRFNERAMGYRLGATWADYDQDGYPDLCVVGFYNGPPIYRNLGNGTFVGLTEGPLGQGTFTAGIATWADYDNDLRVDLFLGGLSSGATPDSPNRLYHNLGQGNFGELLLGDEIHALGGGVWGDYDNDGDLDLFVPNGAWDWSEDDALYENQGDGSFQEVTSGSLVHDSGNSWGAAWGDYDNDGFLDLFVVNGTEGEENCFYRNNGNANHWIKIRCIGTAANRAGIGAKVFVTATIFGKQVTQMREIGSGYGQDSSGFGGAHFGLGDATLVEKLVVKWPGPRWTEQTLFNIPAGKPGERPLEIVEEVKAEGPVLAAEWRGNLRLTLEGEVGVTYRIETSADLVDWSSLTSLTITNADGRVTYDDLESSHWNQRYYRAGKQ
jgi:hypothetical protein